MAPNPKEKKLQKNIKTEIERKESGQKGTNKQFTVFYQNEKERIQKFKKRKKKVQIGFVLRFL